MNFLNHRPVNEIILREMIKGDVGMRPIDQFVAIFNEIQKEHLSMIRYMSDEPYTIRAISVDRCAEIIRNDGIGGIIKMILDRMSEQHYEQALRLKKLKDEISILKTKGNKISNSDLNVPATDRETAGNI